MCIHPTQIPNPNHYSDRDPKSGLGFLKDTSSAFINIPCGHCPECIAIRQMGIVQRLNVEYKFNYLFFCMLSYNNECLPIHTCSNGRTIPYADKKDITDCLKRLRVRNAFGRPFRYFGVSEFGGDKHRPHFHIILIIPKYDGDDVYTPVNLEALVFKELLFDWRRNVAIRVRKKDGKIVPDNVHPQWVNLCTYRRINYRNGTYKTNFDVQFVRPLNVFQNEDSVSFYASKYILKDSEFEKNLWKGLHMNLDSDEFKFVWKIVKSKSFWSRGLGLNAKGGNGCEVVPDPEAVRYVHDMVEKSKQSYDSPRFLADNGSVYPLSRYYYRYGSVYSYRDAIDFFLGSEKEKNDGVVYSDDNRTKVHLSEERFYKLLQIVDSHEKLHYE